MAPLFGIPLSHKIFYSTLVGTSTSIMGFFVWTKHCHMELPLDPNTEPLYKSPFYKQYNPRSNPTMSDVCIRRIPLHQLKYEILDDARNGGGKLVEAFTQGCFGGSHFIPQRLIHQRGLPKADQERVFPAPTQAESVINDTPTNTPSESIISRISSIFSRSGTTAKPVTPPPTISPLTITSAPTSPPQHLWTKSQLSTSTYPPSTIITNHFLVLSHTPTSILIRCGSTPFDSPLSPRQSDGLFELSAVPNFEKGYAEFRMTSVFYAGAAENPEVMGQGMQWLHRQYTKLWMESAVGNVRMTKWRSQQAQIQLAKDQMRKEKEEGLGK